MRPNNKIAIIPSYDSILNAIVSDNSISGTVEVATGNGTLSMWDDNGIFHLNNLTLLQFHTPSEHTIDGVHFDAEIHIGHND